MKRTERWDTFANEFIIDFNLGQAYLRSGFKCKPQHARQAAYKLLTTNNYVQQKIQEALKQRIKRTHITQDTALKMLSVFISANIKDYLSFDDVGITFFNSKKLTDEQLACINEVSEVISKRGRSRRLKLISKEKMLELLMRHLGMLGQEPLPGTNIFLSELYAKPRTWKKKRKK